MVFLPELRLKTSTCSNKKTSQRGFFVFQIHFIILPCRQLPPLFHLNSRKQRSMTEPVHPMAYTVFLQCFPHPWNLYLPQKDCQSAYHPGAAHSYWRRHPIRRPFRKYNRKQMVEILCPKNTVKRLKDVDDRTSRIGFPQKSEHKTGLYKMNRKQAFSPGFSDDAIHLHNGCLRFFFKKFLKIRITASQTAPLSTLNSGCLYRGRYFTLRGRSIFLISKSWAST